MKSKQKHDLPNFCYFWPHKSMFTLFKTILSLKLWYIEQQNKFKLIRNELLEFIQFSLLRLLNIFWVLDFLSLMHLFSGRRKYLNKFINDSILKQNYGFVSNNVSKKNVTHSSFLSWPFIHEESSRRKKESKAPKV